SSWSVTSRSPPPFSTVTRPGTGSRSISMARTCLSGRNSQTVRGRSSAICTTKFRQKNNFLLSSSFIPHPLAFFGHFRISALHFPASRSPDPLNRSTPHHLTLRSSLSSVLDPSRVPKDNLAVPPRDAADEGSDIEFDSDGVKFRGWLSRPRAAAAAAPAVV